MKQLALYISILCCLSTAATGNNDTTRRKVLERIVDYVSNKCEMNDSTKDAFRLFIYNFEDKLQQCRSDSVCYSDRLKRQELMIAFKKEMRDQFGASALKAFDNFTLKHYYPPPKRGVMKLTPSKKVE